MNLLDTIIEVLLYCIDLEVYIDLFEVVCFVCYYSVLVHFVFVCFSGTNRLFRQCTTRMGVEESLVDCTDVKNVADAIKPNTKVCIHSDDETHVDKKIYNVGWRKIFNEKKIY